MPDILLMINSDANRRLLENHLADDHDTDRLASDERVAGRYDIVVTDLRNLKERQDELASWREDQSPLVAPVLLLVSMKERERLPVQVWEHVDDVATMPIGKDVLTARLGNLLQRRRLSEMQQRYAHSIEIFNESLQEQVETKTRQLNHSLSEAVLILTRAGESRDHETGEHINRISEYTKHLASALGMDEDFVNAIAHASPMHDIGKIGIPDHILLKAGPLSPEEWSIMKQHTIIGEQILTGGQSNYLVMGAEIARSHHERWDGSGYPDGLEGGDIPLPARVMSLCDVYDALRSRRPYKAGFDHATAIELITKGDGRTRPEHFDPAILGAFERIADDFADIFDGYKHNGPSRGGPDSAPPAQSFQSRFSSHINGREPD
jgi:putative two-component system response regulator